MVVIRLDVSTFFLVITRLHATASGKERNTGFRECICRVTGVKYVCLYGIICSGNGLIDFLAILLDMLESI